MPEAPSKAIISTGRQVLRELTATGSNAELKLRVGSLELQTTLHP
jgi:hypothetical protein